MLTSAKEITQGLHERLTQDSGCFSFFRLALESSEEVTSPQVGDEKFEGLLHSGNADVGLVESYWAQQA